MNVFGGLGVPDLGSQNLSSSLMVSSAMFQELMRADVDDMLDAGVPLGLLWVTLPADLLEVSPWGVDLEPGSATSMGSIGSVEADWILGVLGFLPSVEGPKSP